MSKSKTKAQVKVEANRCPYCRDDVQAEDSVVCQDCLTRHHEPCWQEAGRCSSCSSDTLMRAEAPPDRKITDEEVASLLEQAGYRKSEIEAYLCSHGSDLGKPQVCFKHSCEEPVRFHLGGPGTFHGCQEHSQNQLNVAKALSLSLTLMFFLMACVLVSSALIDGEFDKLFVAAGPILLGGASLWWWQTLPKEPLLLTEPK